MNLSDINKKIHRVMRIKKDIPEPAKAKKVLFIHIPKAAGTSISLELYGIQVSHSKISEYKEFDRKKPNIKTFTIVRNPIDRFISAYNFLKKGGMTEYDGYLRDKYFNNFNSINDFIEWIDFDFINSGKIIHFIPQHEFLYSKGVCKVGYIYKLETLDVSSMNLDLNLDLKFEQLNKNQSKKDCLITDHSKNKLERLYAEDMYLFGYPRG